jgi:DnaK suppressor protein
MDHTQARALLDGERARLQRLLLAEEGEPQAADLGDEVDDADRRTAEQTGTAVDQLLRARWAALQRAEARLAAGSYGRSVRSGQPIPDERLEADNAVGLVSAGPFEVLADADITPEEEHHLLSRAWVSTSSVTTGPSSRAREPHGTSFRPGSAGHDCPRRWRVGSG